MLLDDNEEILKQIPKRHIGPITYWIGTEILNEKLMKLNQWFELAFHLCKQRFDYTMDWMEYQPVPKLLLMAQTLTKHAKEQEREMRKARRKK